MFPFAEGDLRTGGCMARLHPGADKPEGVYPQSRLERLARGCGSQIQGGAPTAPSRADRRSPA